MTLYFLWETDEMGDETLHGLFTTIDLAEEARSKIIVSYVEDDPEFDLNEYNVLLYIVPKELDTLFYIKN